MASGCTSGGSTLSSECFQPISDKCVKYTGPAIQALNICTGDTLNEIEAVILQKIIDFSSGLGIFIPDIDLTACSLFVTSVTCCNGPASVPKQLKDLIKIIFDALCALDTRLTIVEDELDVILNSPYLTTCLSGLSANPTFVQIIQQLLVEFCALKTQVANLQTQVNNLTTSIPVTIGNFLLGHISSCQGPSSLLKTGTGAAATLQFGGFTPIGGIIAFDGDLSMFDSTGLGRTNTSACGWALCNGNNTTPNMQGLTAIGTTNMLTTPPAAADGGTYSHGDVGGKVAVTLISGQIPSVSFTASTASTTGTLDYFQVSRKHASTGDNTMGYQGDGAGTSTAAGIPNGHINFTIPGQSISGSTSGGGKPHENRMPYIALEWVKRLF